MQIQPETSPLAFLASSACFYPAEASVTNYNDGPVNDVAFNMETFIDAVHAPALMPQSVQPIGIGSMLDNGDS